jgi:ribosomal protein S27AE
MNAPPQRFCPSCGSSELEMHKNFSAGWQFKCKNCGYIGTAIEGDFKFEK